MEVQATMAVGPVTRAPVMEVDTQVDTRATPVDMVEGIPVDTRATPVGMVEDIPVGTRATPVGLVEDIPVDTKAILVDIPVVDIPAEDILVVDIQVEAIPVVEKVITGVNLYFDCSQIATNIFQRPTRSLPNNGIKTWNNCFIILVSRFCSL